MSDGQKLRMSMSAAWVGPEDLERRSKKLLENVRCPLVSAYASTGAPSTEASYTCIAYEMHPLLLDPSCPTRGNPHRCALIAAAVRTKNYSVAVRIQAMQRNFDQFLLVSDGGISYFVHKDSADNAD